MIRTATDTIPAARLLERRAAICNSPVPPQIEYQPRTDFSDTDSFNQGLASSKLRFCLRGVGALAVTLMVGHFQAIDAQESSRTAADAQTLRNLGYLSSNATTYPFADFHEPVQFTWSKNAHLIRQAAKGFGEHTHADY